MQGSFSGHCAPFEWSTSLHPLVFVASVRELLLQPLLQEKEGNAADNPTSPLEVESASDPAAGLGPLPKPAHSFLTSGPSWPWTFCSVDI